MATVLEFKRPEPPAPKKKAAKSKRVWHHPTKEYVRAEAEYEIANDGGPNVYTSYLKLYGRYPSPEQARAMGLKLGRHVKADDGKHYPPKSKAEKQHDKEVRARRKASCDRYEQQGRVEHTVFYLAANADAVDPTAVVNGWSSVAASPNFDRDLDKALDWMTRFAAAWRSRHPVKQDV